MNMVTAAKDANQVAKKSRQSPRLRRQLRESSGASSLSGMRIWGGRLARKGWRAASSVSTRYRRGGAVLGAVLKAVLIAPD